MKKEDISVNAVSGAMVPESSATSQLAQTLSSMVGREADSPAGVRFPDCY